MELSLSPLSPQGRALSLGFPTLAPKQLDLQKFTFTLSAWVSHVLRHLLTCWYNKLLLHAASPYGWRVSSLLHECIAKIPSLDFCDLSVLPRRLERTVRVLGFLHFNDKITFLVTNFRYT